MNCDWKGCTNSAARWQPVLVLPAPPPWISEPIRAVLGIRICDECKSRMGLADVLGDEGWAQLCAGIAGAGRMLPRREDVTLEFTTLDSAEAAMLASMAHRRVSVQ